MKAGNLSLLVGPRALLVIALSGCGQAVLDVVDTDHAGAGGGSGAGAGAVAGGGAGGPIACTENNPCGCAGDASCDDLNECTDDACDAEKCKHSKVPNGTLCTGGTCLAGTCEQARLFYRTPEGIFVTRLDGDAAPIQLSPVLDPGGYIARHFRVSADGRYVTYAVGTVDDGIVALYASKADGSARVMLNDALAPGGGLSYEVQIASDGSRAVYLADQSAGDGAELYSVNLDGTDRVQLEPGSAGYFLLTADNRVVYVVNKAYPAFELYSIGLDGKGRVKLAEGVGFGGNYSSELTTIAGNTHVVFMAGEDDEDGWPNAIYASRLDGGGTVKLNPLPLQGMPFDPRVTAGGSHVVYRAIQDTDWTWELYASSIDGTSNVKVNGPGTGVSSFRLMPDGGRVLYTTDEDGDGYSGDLYAGNLDGSGTVKLAEVPGVVDVDWMEVSADTSRVFYRVGSPTGSSLAVSAADGSGTVDLFGYLSRFRVIDPKGTRVVVLGGKETADLQVIHIGDQGDVSTVPISVGGSFFPLLITPDGERVLFRGPEGVAGATELSVVRLDGSGAVGLNVTLPKLEWGDLTEGLFVVK